MVPRFSIDARVAVISLAAFQNSERHGAYFGNRAGSVPIRGFIRAGARSAEVFK